MGFIESVDKITFRLLQKEPHSSGDLSFVYKNSSGEYLLVENGDRLTNAELRKKKYTLRYSIVTGKKVFKEQFKLQSENGIDEFDCTISIFIKVVDPVAYIKSDMDANLESMLADLVKIELRQMAKQFIIDKYSNLESAIDKGLDAEDYFKENGLEIELTPVVDISDEIRNKIRDRRDEIEARQHQRKIQEMEQVWDEEDRNKEFAEFRRIFAGTPVEGYLSMFKSVDQLREHLLLEYKDKRKTIGMLKEKYFNGEIDETQLQKAQNLFQGFDSLLGKMDQVQLDTVEKKQQLIEEVNGNEEEGNNLLETNDHKDQTDEGWR